MRNLATKCLKSVFCCILAASLCVAYAPLAAYADDATTPTTDGSTTDEGDVEPTPEPEPEPELINISKATVTLSGTQYLYTGKSIKPSVTVKMKNAKGKLVTIKKTGNYTVTYSNYIKAGTATVTIKGKGSYTGTVKKTYKIVSLTYKARKSGKWVSTTMGHSVSTSSTGMTGIRVSGVGVTKSIYYSVMQNGSWSSYAHNGATAGAAGKTVTGIRLVLKSTLAKKYTIWYRVKVNKYGWLDWAKNGERAGSTGLGLKVISYQVKLQKRGTSAPGARAYRYVTSTKMSDSISKLYMRSKIANLSSNTQYCIAVSRSLNRVAIFKGSKGKWTLYKFMSCCTGKASTPTPAGTYKVGIKNLHFGEEKNYTCWYATQITGEILFHSILYNVGSKTSVMDGTMGANVSHGCVRLSLSNAKWIYNNIMRGTTVRVF